MQENNPPTNAPAAPAEQMLAMLRGAEAAVFIETDSDNALTIRAVTTSGNYDPQHNASHAFVAAIQLEHGHLMDVVNGRYTDALRFRALRDFAVLANVDPARFEIVSSMLHAYEESESLADEKLRTEADFVKIADFMVHALLETDPAEQTEHDAERIRAAEEKRDRKAGLRLVGANGQPLH